MKETSPRKPDFASHARWLVTGVIIVAILLGSLLPGGVLTIGWNIEPPVKHLIAYGILGTLLVLAARADWSRAFAIAIALAVAGVLIEILQIFIRDRFFMWIDMLTGAVGAIGGVIFGRFLQWFVR
ncbi:MAG: hypothetical protein GVY36_02655 [Verrucomicrobia bacterium]|jgi:hypothetical protein|nr:hypothetical protein [Verrucomicrobiota bacterium]